MSKPKKIPKHDVHVWLCPAKGDTWTRWHGGGRATASLGDVIARALRESAHAPCMFDVIVAPADTSLDVVKMELTREGEHVRPLWEGRFELIARMPDRPEDYTIALGDVMKGGNS